MQSGIDSFFTGGFSPGLRTQFVQWENSDYLLFPHQVYLPKSVKAKLSKPSSQYLVIWKHSDHLLFSHKVHKPKSVEAKL